MAEYNLKKPVEMPTSNKSSGKEPSMSAKNLNENEFPPPVYMPSINTMEQYLHEKEAGDPNALNLPFSEWKKL